MFPEVISGDSIDFEILKQVLGQYVDDNNERYRFTWNGKGKSLRLSQTPTLATLRPCIEESKDWDDTQNLYIEGDNLEVLKLLQKSYFNQIKLIYIDPPYNTGKEFVYPDNFKNSIENYKMITGQTDTDGNIISTNSETSGRYHTNWLNMMYPRLRLARNLLKNDGAIFISIDDHEVDNLKKICNEVFGEDNFIAQFPWQSRQSVQNDTDISSSHEYIVAYAKIRRKSNRRLKETNIDTWFEENSFVCLPLPLDKDKFDNPDSDSRGLWKAGPFDAPKERPNLTYAIINPNTDKEYWPPRGRHWRTEESNYKKLLKDKRICFGKAGKTGPQLKVFYDEKKLFGSVDNTWWDGEKCGTTTDGTNELQKIFDGFSPFETPKPTKLLRKIIRLVSLPDKSDIILDFFSGSSSMAHAIMQENADEGGNRKFIMIQLPEPTPKNSEAYKENYKNICEIGKERIRRSGEKIMKEMGTIAHNLDIGFKVFKLDTSNIRKWQPDRENLEKSLLDNVDNFVKDRTILDVVHEIILKLGFKLTCHIDEVTISDNTVYFVDNGKLIICLDDGITTETATGILEYTKKIEHENIRVVFKDNGFKSDSEKANVKEILSNGRIEEFITL